MTATTASTASTGLGAGRIGGASRLTAVLFALVLLAAVVVGSFAVGRITADTTVEAPAAITVTPPQHSAATCVHVAHTPPC